MSTWQITILFSMAGCAVVCLLWISIAIEKLFKAIFSIGTALTQMNAKIEKIETVNKEHPADQDTADSAFADIEAALSSFEKLKRIDITKPE
jgi:uncharacterized protein YoxC